MSSENRPEVPERRSALVSELERAANEGSTGRTSAFRAPVSSASEIFQQEALIASPLSGEEGEEIIDRRLTGTWNQNNVERRL